MKYLALYLAIAIAVALFAFIASSAFGPWTYDVFIIDSKLVYGIPYFVA